jgi:hypothetical protein
MKILFSVLAVLVFSLTLVSCPGDDVTIPQIKGCMDPGADNYNPQANADCDCCQKKGSLLFWTNDPFILPTCGTITVKLDNGQQTNITGYYYVAPTDCINRFGGYLSVEEGTYSYTITTQFGCVINSGVVKVIGKTCNFAKVN